MRTDTDEAKRRYSQFCEVAYKQMAVLLHWFLRSSCCFQCLSNVEKKKNGLSLSALMFASLRENKRQIFGKSRKGSIIRNIKTVSGCNKTSIFFLV